MLLVQAAADGIIDFNKAAPLDRRWWVRTKWLLDRLAAKFASKVITLTHHQYVAALNPLIEKSTYDEIWNKASAQMDKFVEIYFPDIKATDKKDNYASLVNKWRAAYGDTKDPDVQKRIQETAKRWLENSRRKMALMAEEKAKAQDRKRNYLTKRRSRRKANK